MDIKGEEFTEEILRLYTPDESPSLKKIADKIARKLPDQSLSSGNVKKILEKHGVKIRHNRQKPKKRFQVKG